MKEASKVISVTLTIKIRKAQNHLNNGFVLFFYNQII